MKLRNYDESFVYLEKETKGKPIVEFVILISKMYYIKVCHGVIDDPQPRITTLV